MEKRAIIFGDYNTATQGWTLTKWKLSAAEQKTNYVDKIGGDGSWDLSTALTDDIPIYKTRTLTATFECSEGDRMSREAEICNAVNLLDGMRKDIQLPDDDLHYIIGRLHVAKDYNDPYHAAIKVTATCEPWKFAKADTVVTLTAGSSEQEAVLTNSGRRVVVPTLEVETSVLLSFGTASKALSAGVYQWADLLLIPGNHVLTYSGSGTVKITYREAVLE